MARTGLFYRKTILLRKAVALVARIQYVNEYVSAYSDVRIFEDARKGILNFIGSILEPRSLRMNTLPYHFFASRSLPFARPLTLPGAGTATLTPQRANVREAFPAIGAISVDTKITYRCLRAMPDMVRSGSRNACLWARVTNPMRYPQRLVKRYILILFFAAIGVRNYYLTM